MIIVEKKLELHCNKFNVRITVAGENYEVYLDGKFAGELGHSEAGWKWENSDLVQEDADIIGRVIEEEKR